MKMESNVGIRVVAPAIANESTRNSSLVDYALRGLQHCWLPEEGRWSHIYHLDGRASPNESLPHSDVFYTLNVLLAMSRVKDIPPDVNVSDTFGRNVALLNTLPVAKYAYGMALWAAAELGLHVPRQVAATISSFLSDEAKWGTFRAQDLGMLLTGVVAQAKAGNTEWERFAGPLYRVLRSRFASDSGLFFDTASGFRRRFASFATQTYLSIACYHYGERAGDPAAIGLANRCVSKLISLQGPQGEWPWFFDAASGLVLDFYEVYSVHQYGMAPALLECAERHNVFGAREALAKGFRWVLGENQLSRSMLVPEFGLSIRSQIRKGELSTKIPRMLRAMRNSWLPHEVGLISPDGVGLRLECRSYELGWILWSFGRRTDLPELSNHPAFS